MLTQVGYLYPDLVKLYCHADWDMKDSSFLQTGVWKPGTIVALA